MMYNTSKPCRKDVEAAADFCSLRAALNEAAYPWHCADSADIQHAVDANYISLATTQLSMSARSLVVSLRLDMPGSRSHAWLEAEAMLRCIAEEMEYE